MVSVTSLNLCRMFVIICTLSLCPGCLSKLLSSEKETRESLNQEREREGDSQIVVRICYHQCVFDTLANTQCVFATVANAQCVFATVANTHSAFLPPQMRICHRSEYSSSVFTTQINICFH